MEKLLVRCEVQEGMFSNESFVTIKTGYDEVQSLVSKDLIENGKIELAVDTKSDAEFSVIIPGEITKGQRLVRLKRPTPEV